MIKMENIKFIRVEEKEKLDYENLSNDLQDEEDDYNNYEDGKFVEDLKRSKVYVNLYDEDGNIYRGSLEMTVGLLESGNEFLLVGNLEEIIH